MNRKGRPPVDLARRFWAKVDIRDRDQCWLWKGSTRNSGYGKIKVGGRRDGRHVSTHRVSWELANGQAVPDGLFVLHTCDNRLCVNPNHLFLGTRQDNIDDMTRKGRQIQGEAHHSAKLTSSDVKRIRKIAHKFSCKDLREMFGINHSSLWKIINKKTWKGVC